MVEMLVVAMVELLMMALVEKLMVVMVMVEKLEIGTSSASSLLFRCVLILFHLQNGTLQLSGIVSWGVIPCAQSSFPSVYTNVGYFRCFKLFINGK